MGEAYELKIDASNHQGACRKHVGLCLLEREESLLFTPRDQGRTSFVLTGAESKGVKCGRRGGQRGGPFPPIIVFPPYGELELGWGWWLGWGAVDAFGDRR